MLVVENRSARCRCREGVVIRQAPILGISLLVVKCAFGRHRGNCRRAQVRSVLISARTSAFSPKCASLSGLVGVRHSSDELRTEEFCAFFRLARLLCVATVIGQRVVLFGRLSTVCP